MLKPFDTGPRLIDVNARCKFVPHESNDGLRGVVKLAVRDWNKARTLNRLRALCIGVGLDEKFEPNSELGRPSLFYGTDEELQTNFIGRKPRLPYFEFVDEDPFDNAASQPNKLSTRYNIPLELLRLRSASLSLITETMRLAEDDILSMFRMLKPDKLEGWNTREGRRLSNSYADFPKDLKVRALETGIGYSCRRTFKYGGARK